MDTVKLVFLNKLVLRLMYIVAAFATSHLVALGSSPIVSNVLSGAGVNFSISDPLKLKTAITAGMLFGGEFVYHWIHEKFILPKVQPQGEIK